MTPAGRESVNAMMALESLQQTQPDFQWLDAKFSGGVVWKNQNQPLAGTIRLKKDSAIYVSVAPMLGIEVARAIITRDSVKILNRLDSSYYLGNIDLLNKMFNTDLDFQMLQSVLLARDFPHFATRGFKITNQDPLLMLENENRTRSKGGGQSIRHLIHLDPETMRMKTNIVLQNNESRSLRTDYREFENIDSRWVPTDIKVMFSDGVENSQLNMKLNRIKLNEPKNMRFSIPSRYKEVKLTN